MLPPEHAFFLNPRARTSLLLLRIHHPHGGTTMTIKAKFLLGAAFAALAACDQGTVPAGNQAAPQAAEAVAEAESDPANTLENQAAALAEDSGSAASSDGANEAGAAAANGAEAGQANSQE